MDIEPLGRYDLGESLPCPDCSTLVRPLDLPIVGVETVRCSRCGKLLRHRAALTAEQRAQAKILRIAARVLEQEWASGLTVRARVRREWRDSYHGGVLQSADLLYQWSRTIHKRPRAK